nr:MAG TPA: hypothetical protein [Caudoviricetes sp.]
MFKSPDNRLLKKSKFLCNLFIPNIQRLKLFVKNFFIVIDKK